MVRHTALLHENISLMPSINNGKSIDLRNEPSTRESTLNNILYPVEFTDFFAIVLFGLPSISIKGETPMKLEDVKKIAKDQGLQVRNMKKVDLIRSIQRNEGNIDCYNSDSSDTCGQFSCLWRDDCR